MRKIIVAGAGHGGLTAASYLATKGYDVTVYESKDREQLGYDWDDAIAQNTFTYAGIDTFDIKDVIEREKSAFFSASLKTPIFLEFSKDHTLYEIERKVLYNYLIDHAIKCGVKLIYNKKVDKAAVNSITGKVYGLVIDGQVIEADLVIDSAGMFSPVRESLPEYYGVNRAFRKGEIFYTYRALFNLVEGKDIHYGDRFNIYFKFNGINGIAWFKIVNGLADVLIGSVTPMTIQDVDKHLEKLRQYQQCIGHNLMRGGEICFIPLRACFPKIVGDNYAAVGDCVSMPIPVNGSGLTNSIIAGKLLADTVMSIDFGSNDNNEYTNEKLWDYQVKYFKQVGLKMISIDLIKRCLLSYHPKVLDYFFDSGVLTSKELKDGSMGKELTMDIRAIFDKIKRGYKKLPMLLRLSNAAKNSKKAKQHASEIPIVYNEAAFSAWQAKYEAFLK